MSFFLKLGGHLDNRVTECKGSPWWKKAWNFPETFVMLAGFAFLLAPKALKEAWAIWSNKHYETYERFCSLYRMLIVLVWLCCISLQFFIAIIGLSYLINFLPGWEIGSFPFPFCVAGVIGTALFIRWTNLMLSEQRQWFCPWFIGLGLMSLIISAIE